MFTVNRMIILILIKKIHSLNTFDFVLIPFLVGAIPVCLVYLWVVQDWECNVRFPPNWGTLHP